MPAKKKGRPVGSITRAMLKGEPLKWYCHGAKTTTNECGPEDHRVFCYGFNDCDSMCEECKTCGAFVGNIDSWDLEERCQQLEQLAREMCEWCAGVIRRNWTIVPERVDGFREKLEELGVSLDG